MSLTSGVMGVARAQPTWTGGLGISSCDQSRRGGLPAVLETRAGGVRAHESGVTVDIGYSLAVRAVFVAAAHLGADACRGLVVGLSSVGAAGVVDDAGLELVRRLAGESGLPTTVEYDSARSGLIREALGGSGPVSASALVRRHGGWRAVLEAARVVTGPVSEERLSGRLVRRYSDERILECLVACWLALGHRPSVPEYGRWRDATLAGRSGDRPLGVDIPTASTVTLRFSTWLVALAHAWPLVMDRVAL
jgi:hypothetical protein